MFKCVTCDKGFTTNASLKRHIYCKGLKTDPICIYCDKSFSNNSNKTRHQKICKKNTIINIDKSITNNIDNSITNNIDNSTHITNNIVINNFNNENIEYLDQKTKTELMLKLLDGDMLNFILNYSNEIYLNPHHPENTTIKKSSIRNYLDIMIQREFKPYHKNLVYGMMLEKARSYVVESVKDPIFTKPILVKLHTNIIPFTKWKNIGYSDLKDIGNPLTISFTSKQIEKMNESYINEFYKLFIIKKLQSK